MLRTPCHPQQAQERRSRGAVPEKEAPPPEEAQQQSLSVRPPSCRQRQRGARPADQPGRVEEGALTGEAAAMAGPRPCVSREGCAKAAVARLLEVGVQCEDADAAGQVDEELKRLRAEKEDIESRLEFVEELVGPTEAQRKTLHEQVVAARAAALRAKYRGAGIPTRVTGRLDERLLWTRGMSERDAGLLQGGCLPDKEGILQDVSLLGDPNFQPYDQRTGEVKWHSRGGMLKISLSEVRSRFGEDIAQDVVRCAKELDTYDASRRVGVELPWHPVEDRELHPAEVIDLMDRELGLQVSASYVEELERPLVVEQIERPSPYAVMLPPPRRGRRRGRGRGERSHSVEAVHLPQVQARRPAGLRCTLPVLPGHMRSRLPEALDRSLLFCGDRVELI